MGLSFILSILLGRLLGAKGFGAYTLILSWASVLSMASVFGLDRLLVREVAAYTAKAAWGQLRGLLQWSSRLMLAGTLVMATLLLYNRGALFSQSASPEMFPIVILIVLLSPFVYALQALLSGFGRIAESQIMESILPPLAMLVMISLVIMISQLTLFRVITFNLTTIGIVLIFGFWRVSRVLPQEINQAQPSPEQRRWLVSASHLFLLGGLNVVSQKMDILMLGAMSGQKELGIYAAALRGSNLISLPLNMIVVALAPTIARLYAEGKLAVLQGEIIRLVRSVFLMGLVIAIIMNIGSHWFLGLYGSEFTAGTTAFAILSVGQLVNVAAGPVACLLTMTRFEGVALAGISLGALITLILGATLIGPWGAKGAAVASTSGVITWNLFLAWSVRRRLGISPMAFSKKDSGNGC